MQMKTKEEIVANWLPRYTKRPLDDFTDCILLTNFNYYVDIFANKFGVPVLIVIILIMGWIPTISSIVGALG